MHSLVACNKHLLLWSLCKRNVFLQTPDTESDAINEVVSLIVLMFIHRGIHVWCFSREHVNEQRRLELCQHPELIRVGRKSILFLFVPKNNSYYLNTISKVANIIILIHGIIGYLLIIYKFGYVFDHLQNIKC